MPRDVHMDISDTHINTREGRQQNSMWHSQAVNAESRRDTVSHFHQLSVELH